MLRVCSSGFLAEGDNVTDSHQPSHVGLGDMAQKIITIIIFISVDIDNYQINVKSLFLSSLKPDVCSKVKDLETRPLIFLNTIII